MACVRRMIFHGHQGRVFPAVGGVRRFRWGGLACQVVALLALLAGCAGPPRATGPGVPEKGLWNLDGKPPHLVAHYMPWFRVHKSAEDPSAVWSHWKWTGGGPAHDPEQRRPDGLRDVASVAYPLIGPYDSWSREVMRYHLRTAKAASIQAFLMIWYGPGSYEDQQVRLMLDLAQEVGMRIALCYEEKLNFPGYRTPATRGEAVASAVGDLTYLLREYGSHPAYLKRNGTPFVFQFNHWGAGPLGPKYFTPDEFKAIFAQLPSPVVYGRQNLDEAYHPPVSSAYIWWTPDTEWLDRFPRRAAELRTEGRLDFIMTMICPGFDDAGVWGWGQGPRKTERRGLSVLRDTFERSFNGSPELVQVVTWNDFEEGTAMEPTRENGFWYLDALEVWWGERTGSRVDLADNRIPFRDFAKACSVAERAELPSQPWEALLAPRPLEIEQRGVLGQKPAKP